LRHLPASLESVLRFKQYRRHARQDLFLAARTCLERLVEVDPNDSEAMACLSQIYSDGHRCAFAEDQPAELQSRAIELARKSIELAPNSSRGHHALGIALWFSGDADACIETLHRARALNPNSVDAVADLGLFLCLRGEWAEGISFINDANEGNCASSGLHRLGLSLHQFLNGQFEQALSEARRTRAEGVPGAMVAQAIALVRLGHKQEAIAVLARIRRRRSDGARDVLGGLGGGLVQSALAAEIRSALREADSVPANVAMM
jgi:Flp pilus assembly protein TadD